MRKIVTVLTLAACTSLLVACGQRPQAIGSQTYPLPANSVLITNQSFIPHQIVVTAGQTVTWRWDDSLTPHNVTFDDLAAQSPTQVRGKWSYTFNTAGTYYYRCSIHRNMYGEVVVRAG